MIMLLEVHFIYTELKTHKGEPMPNPTKLIINCADNSQTEVELTDEEVAQLEADRQAAKARRAEEEAIAAQKLATKAAVLERLGLTEEEAAALLA